MKHIYLFLSLLLIEISAHQPEQRFFDENLVRIYPARGEVLYDEKNSICLNQYWVPLEDFRYEKKYLPTHCDGRLLTIGHPELRLSPVMIKLPDPPFLHSTIRRDLSSGSLEFSKNFLRFLLLTARKIRSGLQKEWDSRWDHKLKKK